MSCFERRARCIEIQFNVRQPGNTFTGIVSIETVRNASEHTRHKPLLVQSWKEMR